MSLAYYSINPGTAISLSAATVKTVLGVKAHANSGIQVHQFSVDFDGVTAANTPVLVEFCYCTFATNSPGTNSTSVTPVQLAGRVLTAGFTAAKEWSSAPTVLTVADAFQLDPNKGLFRYDFPLGMEPDAALAEGYALRCTAPANVNVFPTMKVSRV